MSGRQGMRLSGTLYYGMQHAKDFVDPLRILAGIGLEPGMNIADFGAGSGAYTLAAARSLHNAGHVYAIDVQKDLLRRISNEAAHRRLRNVNVIWADLEMPSASKLADHSIDIVIVSNLLFQLIDKMPPLREAHRILKKRGTLVIVDWSDSFRHMGPSPEDVVTREAALQYAKRAHFTQVSDLSAGAHHYGLILKPHHG
jgi:ubiquinone/menaquinone biosynthesis C-methylase UbiE